MGNGSSKNKKNTQYSTLSTFEEDVIKDAILFLQDDICERTEPEVTLFSIRFQ